MVPLVECTLFRALNHFQKVFRCSSLDAASASIGEISLNSTQNEEENKKEKLHIYRETMKKDEVINFLAENIYYNKDGIIVTNKPYGIGQKKLTKVLPNYLPQTINEYFLDDILPELSKKLKVNSLQVVQAPERYASGVTILAKNDKAKENMTTRIKNLKQRGIYYDTYLVVVVGNLKSHLNTKFGIKVETKDKNKPYPVVVNKWPKQFQNRENLRVYQWNHEVLASSDLASLVKVNLSSPRLNSLKLFLSTKCLAPVLGDPLFGSRVIKLNNVKVLADPVSHQKRPNYDPELLAALEVHKEDASIIPNHVHLLSKTLPFSKKKKSVVTVPPTGSFVWTCEQLGLNLDTQLLDEDHNSQNLIES